MQKDMHYYATYAMAKAAGISPDHAAVIAYAAQFTDDSQGSKNEPHKDGGLFFGITTAHSTGGTIVDSAKNVIKCDGEEQRRVWVPFHFFPGGEGETFQEKIICVRDSKLVQKMFSHHIALGSKKAFILELIGIAAHVYMDTFSHYGFSGIESEYNKVVGDIDQINQKEDVLREIRAKLLGNLTNRLGHSGVDIFPDLPYLKWEFTFAHDRPGNGAMSKRDNPKNFLKACKRLHEHFCRFANRYYSELPNEQVNFKDIEQEVIRLIAFEDTDEDERSKNWIESLAKDAPPYDSNDWEQEKEKYFEKLATSYDSIDTYAYRFHQAAAFHRYYVLKDLLPEHGIAVY